MARAPKESVTPNLPARRARGEVGQTLNYEDELAKYAQENASVAEATASTGNWMTFQGGVMKYKNAEIPDGKVEVIVLRAMLENLFYEEKFDPDQPTTPVCFAFGMVRDDMVPHEKSPKVQSEQCKTCPQNAWGSGDTGKGKACKNQIRLALIPWGDATREQIERAEIANAKLPVTSIKNWGGYVGQLTAKYPDRKGVAAAFVTEISVERDAKTQFQVKFRLVEPVDKKLLPAVWARVAETDAMLHPDNPYPPIERAAAPPRGRGNPAKYARSAARR